MLVLIPSYISIDISRHIGGFAEGHRPASPITTFLTYIKYPLFFNTMEGAILETQNSAQGNGLSGSYKYLACSPVEPVGGRRIWSSSMVFIASGAEFCQCG